MNIRALANVWLRRHAQRYQTLNRVELSRSAMLGNVALIQAQHPAQQIIPVLKSNAYGHGLREVAQILNDADVPMLAVDGYFEAMAIRRVTRHRLLVLGYIPPENARLLDTRRCSFVVQDVDTLAALGALRRPVRVHVELNTGMNRLGLSQAELAVYLEVLRRYPQLTIEGVMSHLADADNPASTTMTERQTKVFDTQVDQIRRAGFAPQFIHLAQTAGSTKVHSKYANALRLGIGMYGVSPLQANDEQAGALNDLRPVLTVKSTVIKVIDLRPGDTVGYNATFAADQPIRLGVLPLGYYEGLPRALSNWGAVSAGQHMLPIVGRVSMNHTMIDLGDSGLGVGDEVTVFSANPASPNSITATARAHSLFSYNLLTAIAPTIRRQMVS